MTEILAGSYFKDVLTVEGREKTPLRANQGILISSNGMLIKVEERRLEHWQPPCAALPGALRSQWSGGLGDLWVTEVPCS